MIVAILIGVLVVLLILGIPAVFALGVSSVLYLAVTRGIDAIPSAVVAQRILYGMDSFALLALPLFLFVGRLMNESGVTNRLFGFAKALVGHFRGGLAHVNVLASLIFAGMSGAATADAAGLGAIEIKAMREAGYDLEFSASVTAASSLIGPILPPSVPLVLYAILAGVSVNSLLIAGIVPGILMALALMSYVAYVAHKRQLPVDSRHNLRDLLVSFKDAFLALLTPVILVGGILTGAFTATEAGAVASLYAVILAVLIYRTVSWAKLYDIFRRTMMDSAIIMFILAVANLYSWLLIRARVPVFVADFIFRFSDNYWVVISLVILFLLFMGCFVSAIVTINIATPVLVPLIKAAGGDPLHFGIIMVVTLMIGELTPPFGMVLFAITRVTDIPFERLVRSVAPFIIPVAAVLVLLVSFPGLATAVPNWLLQR